MHPVQIKGVMHIHQEENKCPGAKENGVSILHGNALAFVKVFPSTTLSVFGSARENPMHVDDNIRKTVLNRLFDNLMKACHAAKH